MKKYISSERANLFEPNVYIAMIVKISGCIPEAEAEQAVRRAYQANEATMSKIMLDEDGTAWYEKMEDSGCRFSREEDSWENILQKSEKRPFDLKDGELVRTFMTEESSQTILLIHAHHLAGDGKAMLIFINDIVDSLDGVELAYKPMTLMDRQFLEKRAKLMLPIKLAIKNLNRKWRKQGRSFSWEDYDRIHKKYWETYSSQIEIKACKVQEVREHCAGGVTINSCIITGLLKAHPECKSAGIPVSVREDDNGMSNQTSGITIKYRYHSRKSFVENQRKVHRKIRQKIKNKNARYFVLLCMTLLPPTLLDGVLMYTYGCYQNKLAKRLSLIMGYTGQGGSDLGVTNLNQITIPANHNNFHIENILFIPPKVSYSKKVAGIASYGERLTICHHNMIPSQSIY